jgi:hypothetical protein
MASIMKDFVWIRPSDIQDFAPVIALNRLDDQVTFVPIFLYLQSPHLASSVTLLSLLIGQSAPPTLTQHLPYISRHNLLI